MIFSLIRNQMKTRIRIEFHPTGFIQTSLNIMQSRIILNFTVYKVLFTNKHQIVQGTKNEVPIKIK